MKVYTTLLKRIKLLKFDRSMKINLSNKQHRFILQNYNHYNLINAYKDLFLISRTPEVYKDNCVITELEAMYIFDNKLRQLILKEILILEEKIKHTMTQSFYDFFNIKCRENPETAYNIELIHRDDEYLQQKYYNLTSYKRIGTKREISRIDIYNQFEKKFYETIEFSKRRSESIKNYSNKGYYPLWIAMNVLSLGNISKYYLIQKDGVKDTMLFRMGMRPRKLNRSHEEKRLRDNFGELLSILTEYRNLCAHNERIYNFKIKKPLMVQDSFFNFKQHIDNRDITQKELNEMKKGIYLIFFIISIFKSKKDRSLFTKDVNYLFKELNGSLLSINISEVYSVMGLKPNWSKQVKKASYYKSVDTI